MACPLRFVLAPSLASAKADLLPEQHRLPPRPKGQFSRLFRNKEL